MSDTEPGTMADMRSLGIRLPDDVYAWLAAAAAREHRSLNGQVAHLLERARAEEEERKGKTTPPETP